MKIVGVKLVLSVMGDDGEVSTAEFFNEPLQAGYRAEISLDNGFEVREGEDGKRDFHPTGERDLLVRITRE